MDVKREIENYSKESEGMNEAKMLGAEETVDRGLATIVSPPTEASPLNKDGDNFSRVFEQYKKEKDPLIKKAALQEIVSLWEEVNPGKRFNEEILKEIDRTLFGKSPRQKRMSVKDYEEREIPREKKKIQEGYVDTAVKVFFDGLSPKEQQEFLKRNEKGELIMEKRTTENKAPLEAIMDVDKIKYHLEQKRNSIDIKMDKNAFYAMISKGIRMDEVKEKGVMKKWLTWGQKYEIKTKGMSIKFSTEKELLDYLTFEEIKTKNEINRKTKEAVAKKVQTGREELKRIKEERINTLIQEGIKKQTAKAIQEVKYDNIRKSLDFSQLKGALNEEEKEKIQSLEEFINKYIDRNGLKARSLKGLKKELESNNSLLRTIKDGILRDKAMRLSENMVNERKESAEKDKKPNSKTVDTPSALPQEQVNRGPLGFGAINAERKKSKK